MDPQCRGVAGLLIQHGVAKNGVAFLLDEYLLLESGSDTCGIVKERQVLTDLLVDDLEMCGATDEASHCAHHHRRS